MWVYETDILIRDLAQLNSMNLLAIKTLYQLDLGYQEEISF